MVLAEDLSLKLFEFECQKKRKFDWSLDASVARIPAFTACLAEYGLGPDDPPLVPIVTVGTEEGTHCRYICVFQW